MNKWTQLSMEYANQRSYLDDLFCVYPTIPDGIRDINNASWKKVEIAFENKDNIKLLKALLAFELFPLKDSYVAYFKRDPKAIDRNPRTVNRLCGRLYELGLDVIYKECSKPKETNRQIGPMFKQWLDKKTLGITTCDLNTFTSNKDDAILQASDAKMMDYATKELGYNHAKGLDFIARFNGQYVVGEAKFLTDFGGHQNAQFNDALSTLNAKVNAIPIAILDGVLYIPGNHKMYKTITNEYANSNIMSALVLREFLYSL